MSNGKLKVTMMRGKRPSVSSANSAGQPDVTKPAVDLAAFPILTEEVGYPPSPLARPSTGVSGPPTGTAASGSIGAIATKALNDVLGWKLKLDDPTSFVGALNQSFSLSLVEGHVESNWTPRTYAVQTDLAGGITGAQAAIYTRAKDALDQSLPLLDGLYALNPDADPEVVAALREILRSEMTELVNELGTLGGPRVSRVNQYFHFILGFDFDATSPPVFSPDSVGGTLAKFREELAVWSFDPRTSLPDGSPNPNRGKANPWVNTIEDEQDITNFRILSDYLTSLLLTWINNYNFFLRDSVGLPHGMISQAFLGTQLVLISRQLSVVTEVVNEVRFIMDSVFLGPAERETLLIRFPTITSPNYFGPNPPPSMFVEELLRWIEYFCTDEGVDLIQKAGKLGIGRGFIDVVYRLNGLVTGATNPQGPVPPAYNTPRVRLAWSNLADQLTELAGLAKLVELRSIPPEFGPKV
jgi:hypothetical protein